MEETASAKRLKSEGFAVVADVPGAEEGVTATEAAALLEIERKVDIRPCEVEDLEPLEDAIPSGPSRFHARRFEEQEAGHATYLIAWRDGRPVGHLCLKWRGSDSKVVQQHLQHCPELNAIGVVSQLRSQGIGTQLIARAAGLIREGGFHQVGLAVAVDNPRARALYERLGYQDWGHGEFDGGWTQLDYSGREIYVPERDSYLVKNLA